MPTSIYFSFGIVQPFAPMETAELEEGITALMGDGKIVGLRLADVRMLCQLDEIAERHGLDSDTLWARVRADDDALTGRRGDVFGGVTGR